MRSLRRRLELGVCRLHSDRVGQVDFPTIGPLVDAWIEQHCRIPDGFKRRRPFHEYDWQYWCTANHWRVREGAAYDPDDPPFNQAFHYRRSVIVAAQKALALDTPVATPAGWTTMGEVSPGDVVFDERGEPTRVLSKSQVWHVPTFRVGFSDGSSLVACGDHQWWVERRTKSGRYVQDRIRTTDLGDLRDSGGARRYRVPTARPIQTPEADLPIPPYTLGAWLGDGHSDDARITGLDEGVFARIESDGFLVGRTKIVKRRQIYGLQKSLRLSGLLRNKHVPSAYLRASEKQRWALVQGLMDTDGYADSRQGKCEFTTTQPSLRDGMRDLLWTLGIKNVCYEGIARLNGVATGPKWRISFAARSDMPVFGLERKQSRIKAPGSSHAQFAHRRIISVEPNGVVPTQCLTVEADSHVFLAGREMIPTCNTGKGPLTACHVAVASCGPELFAGWAKSGDVWDCAEHGCDCGWYWEYEPGEPMGARHPSPLIQILATSQEQVANIWRPLVSMIHMGPLGRLLAPRENFIRVLGENADDPDLDRIDAVTASATARLGAPISNYFHDESGTYTTSNKMVDTAETMRRGAAGMQGRGIETTNAWNPAQDSAAQRVFEQNPDDVFIFYRTPPPELSFQDRAERKRLLRFVYEGSPHVSIDSIMAECDEMMVHSPAKAERFFGNRVVAADGSWMDAGVWESAHADAMA